VVVVDAEELVDGKFVVAVEGSWVVVVDEELVVVEGS
jgi:hypothetical protein